MDITFSLIAISFAVAWDFTPRSAGRNKGKVDVKTSASAAKLHSDRQAALQAKTFNGILAETNLGPIPEPTIAPEPADGDEEDPDLPPGMAGRVDKEAYLRARGDYFDMLRGRDQEVPEGAREKAIRSNGEAGKSDEADEFYHSSADWSTRPTGLSLDRTQYHWDKPRRRGFR